MAKLMELSDTSQVAAGQRDEYGRSLSLVMADDSRSDQQLVQHAAECAGVDARFAFHDDGARLLDHLTKPELDQFPDLMLVDLRMPGLDGFSVLEERKAHPILRQIPVLVLTTSALPGDRDRAFANGATYFDTKPGTFDGLIRLARMFPDLARSWTFETSDPAATCFELSKVLIEIE